MSITAFGILLVGISYATPIIFVTYPPFGLVGHSYLTLETYLFSLGFYCSAISVSEDVRLRQSIRRSAIEESRLIESIGIAELEQKIRGRILDIVSNASDAMIQETGIPRHLMKEISNNI